MPLVLSGTNGISTNGTNWALTPDSSGIAKLPNVPSFTVGSNVGPTIGTTYTKITTFGSIVHNNGNCWNGTTQRFTAPVAGTYFFSAQMLPPAANVHTIIFYKNGSSLSGWVWGYHGGGTRMTIGVSAVMVLAANDYVEVYGQSPNAQDGWDNSGFFSGHLIG